MLQIIIFTSWLTDSVYGKSSGQTGWFTIMYTGYSVTQALHWAAEKNHADVALFLLRHGSVAIAEDEAGKKPQDLTSHAELCTTMSQEQHKKYICIKFATPIYGLAMEYKTFARFWGNNHNKQGT